MALVPLITVVILLKGFQHQRSSQRVKVIKLVLGNGFHNRNQMDAVLFQDHLRKRAQGRPSAPMQKAALGFMLYSVFSISEDLIQFPFHGARLGKFQRIRLTDMVGGDAVILCKAQNVADGNAVDDLSRRKPIDLFGKDLLFLLWHIKTPHFLNSIPYCLTNGVQFKTASAFTPLSRSRFAISAAWSMLAQKITVFLPLIRTSVRSMLYTILGMMSFRHFNKFALL